MGYAMDDSWFANLLRAVTASNSRRSVLRALGTLALSGGAGTSFEEAEARRCGECRRKKGGRCKNRPNGTYCSVGTCTNGRCGCASIDDCYVNGGTGSDGQVCQDGKCVCTDQFAIRCKEFYGYCSECCDGCSGGRFCQIADGPYRCYCNLIVAVDCQQVCIPKACAAQCAKSCSGIGADCGCPEYLSCQAEAPGEYYCLPTGKSIT
jgi:hypothetical protein